MGHIYAAGDCAGPHEIVHIAIKQGETAVKHMFGQKVEPIHYDYLLGVVFTDPQVAQVGLPLPKIRERGIDPISASFPFDDHGKSILMEAKRMVVKLFMQTGLMEQFWEPSVYPRTAIEDSSCTLSVAIALNDCA